MILGIVGSRNGADQMWFEQKMTDWVSEFGGLPELVVSGGASGIDHMAEQWALEQGITLKIFPADWKTHGRAAGPIRNQQIVNACTHILAFPSRSGRGTQDTIRRAEKAIKEHDHPMESVVVIFIPSDK